MSINRSLAATLGLCLLVGCAAPTVAPTTISGTPAQDAAAQAPAAAAPQAPVQAQPVVVARAAIATLQGKATFKGEALSGYAVSVLDARTGAPVTLANDLTGAKDLTVLNQNLVTAADGTFKLQVAGLTPGQALRVQVKKGNGLLETIVTSDQKALGAKQRRVFDGTPELTVSELTTAIARLARGVLEASSILTPEAAAPVLAKLSTEMATLSDKLGATLAQTGMAGDIVRDQGKDAAGSVRALLSSAGELRHHAETVAGLVGDVAKSAQATENQSSVEVGSALSDKLGKIDFDGTVLSAAFDAKQHALVLSNAITGDKVDASSGNLASVTTVVQTSSGGSSGPVQPSWVALVGTVEELAAALKDNSKTTIKLTQSITLTQPALAQDIVLKQSVAVAPSFTLVQDIALTSGRVVVGPVLPVAPVASVDSGNLDIQRPLTIDGQGFSLLNAANGGSIHTISSNDVTLKNLTLDNGVEVAAGTNVTIDHVTFSGTLKSNSLDLYTHATVSNCTFKAPGAAVWFNYETTADDIISSLTGNTFVYNGASTSIYTNNVLVYVPSTSDLAQSFPDMLKALKAARNTFSGAWPANTCGMQDTNSY